ncbi:multi-sensor signal transduction histidine kinase [Tolypothrix tenuis PCC 7101]|uniref:histidine kinase n=1 Tax=Tolypothrix tenuis PCC 7101 TaxID=231146 RepID=A0A1Z4N0E7_9CYAN|nr:GAF domain-containing protein [Aulosira sp. FACHB-113]BAY99192.1 multi-sensor signal transduction histidine kinase [Tolypothrix tenuis PCC 7101]BAZ76885.1 multi-sensor signal transduction histidine kinase [Aulosira laxa NIES-50]
MSQSEETTAQNPFLTNHDRRAIHLAGSIQPHGVLLALNSQLEILQVSNNTQQYFGKATQDLLGQSLDSLFDARQTATIKQCWEKNIGSVSSYKVAIITNHQEQFFDCIVHRTADVLIVELEATASNSEISFFSFHGLVSDAIAQMQNTANLVEFLDLVVTELRKITEFDRVMAYQFDGQGAGAVVAEAKQEDLPPYLGLHYPETDIPIESRELYTRCKLRFIPDFNAQAVNLVPINHPITHQPLDLTLSVLRGVDTCCVEFHQNMGVRALLVISLMQEGKLWGLISCHHHTPKYLAYEVRKICEFLGQIVSSELAHKVSHSEWDYEVKLKALQSELLASISQADNFIDALIKPEIRLLDVVSAAGAAVCLDNEITLVGVTPNLEQVQSLIEWADTQVRENLFYTDSLAKLYPDGIVFKDTASGLLLLRISQVRRYYILWFRPEVMQTVNWAGNPNESIHLDVDGNVTLGPRKSFAKWQETVQLTSLPWKKSELDSAIALRNAIVGIVLSKADELAKINLELERSNRELSSFAYAASHDLKEPLRGIYNYSTVLIEDYAHVLDAEGIEYIETVVTLSVRMEALINALLRLAQLGKAQLRAKATDINELINQVIDIFYASRQYSQVLDIRIPRPLPTISCDAVLVNEVFSNLVGNALKYNDKAEQWVEIGYLDAAQQQTGENSAPVFYVRDNGIGIPEHHRETIFRLFKRLHSQEKFGGGVGAGLAIVKKIIELHNGQIWLESNVGLGSTFYFTL